MRKKRSTASPERKLYGCARSDFYHERAWTDQSLSVRGNDSYTFSDPMGKWAEINNGIWVENGKSLYSLSGGFFTDQLGCNFGSDLVTLAPVPKLGLLGKFENLLFKPQYENLIDLRANVFNTYVPLSKTWIVNRPKLTTPPFPPRITSQNAFGQDFLKWGKGVEGALIRTENITKFEVAAMQSKGLTQPMVEQWRTFYANKFLGMLITLLPNTGFS